MKTLLKLMIIPALMIAVSSCYPGGAEYVDELDTSISKYDPDYGWNNLDGAHYYLPDEILHIKNGEENEKPDRTHDEAILAKIRYHLEEIEGMQPAVANVDTALAMAVTIIEQNNQSVGWIPGGGWWGGWYPWYPDWGWGGYYPWYPVYYNYKTGSVVVEIADFNKKESKQPPLVFIGVLDGLMQGSKDYASYRLDRGLDEVFSHPPFEHVISNN
ncbi:MULTISPECIES: DUF4136 domain-containing protein [unclassified Carboxylicivirga]|uniref:DUF4136 domain-containing protein n=1 Tax=Carboxylicivirga TaxID=1628153 RepID=UPI003D325210